MWRDGGNGVTTESEEVGREEDSPEKKGPSQVFQFIVASL